MKIKNLNEKEKRKWNFKKKTTFSNKNIESAEEDISTSGQKHARFYQRPEETWALAGSCAGALHHWPI